MVMMMTMMMVMMMMVIMLLVMLPTTSSMIMYVAVMASMPSKRGFEPHLNNFESRQNCFTPALYLIKASSPRLFLLHDRAVLWDPGQLGS